MIRRFVPITLGAPKFRGLDLEGFRVTDARFAPNQVLEPHEHERASIAVMLDGAFDLEIGGRRFECPPGTFFTEPPGERHANHIARDGAHVLVVQPDPQRDETLRGYSSLIDAMHHVERSPASRFARSISQELQTPDTVTPLAVEGLILEMLAFVARSRRGKGRRTSPPPWLVNAEEMMRSDFRQPLPVSVIAAEVGVHPAHLARTFRCVYGVSVATYVRRLRVDWAAKQLVSADASLASIAYDAGFADQSHFTRVFKSTFGLTPARYRRSSKR